MIAISTLFIWHMHVSQVTCAFSAGVWSQSQSLSRVFEQSRESESEVSDSDSRVLSPFPLAWRVLIVERRMIKTSELTVYCSNLQCQRSFSADHSLLCTLFMCFFIYSGSVNPFPQNTQVYCFSSLCIFMCLDRSYLCLYPFPQILQEQDLSSLCLIIC